jgi:hypothetical protein
MVLKRKGTIDMQDKNKYKVATEFSVMFYRKGK